MDAYSPEDSFLINSLPLNANQFEAGSEALNSVPSILVWNTELNVFQRINTKTNEVLNQFNSNQEYKVYTALLTQSGTDAPVATVLSNTIGEVPIWSYSDIGLYLLTLPNAWVSNKTVIIPPSNANNTGGAVSSFMQVFGVAINSTSVIKLTVGKMDTGYGVIQGSDNYLYSPNKIEIRVYN